MPTYTTAIANVYNSVTNKIEKNLANITYGDITNGTGTIKVFTGNNNVIGTGTAFTTQLGNSYIIRNSANVFVGRIASIANANSATLTTNANVAISGSSFKYQSYMANLIVYDPHLGNGNISTFSTNNAVIGTGTAFITQLDVGYQIFDTNNANLVGVIKTITSNTVATLTTVSGYPATSIPYKFYNPESKNTSNIFPKNGHVLHSAMLDWSRSGLIPNVKQVHSYHPPVQDPVTGILVNFPATIHSSTLTTSIPLDTINTLSSTGVTAVSNNAVITGFNDENGIVDSSNYKALRSIPINKILKKIADTNMSSDHYSTNVNAVINTIYGAPTLLTPPGLVVDAIPSGFSQVPTYNVSDVPYIAYQGPGGNVVYMKNEAITSLAYNTIADKLALLGNHQPPQRVTDTKEGAAAYFSSGQDPNNLTEAERVDLAARASKQFTTGAEKKMLITGIPASIPGQLNVILHDEDPSQKTYTVPKYNNEFIGIGRPPDWNPDLPISALNEPPAPL